MELEEIEQKALKWLKNKRRGNIKGIEPLYFVSSQGPVVHFYDENTGDDMEEMMTVPMVQDLIEGKSPRRIRNKCFEPEKEEG